MSYRTTDDGQFAVCNLQFAVRNSHLSSLVSPCHVGSLKNFLKGTLVFLSSIVYCLSSAQDIHFTQFFSNPLILNPAQTGNFNGNYRVGFNFKGQWPWAIAGSPYNYH